MPRQARLDIPGLLHHVNGARNRRARYLCANKERITSLSQLAEMASENGGPTLYARTLIRICSGQTNTCCRQLRRLMTVHAVNYKRKGHLFQNRFKSIVVEEEPYLLELIRYIHLYPARVRIMKSVDALAGYLTLAIASQYLNGFPQKLQRPG